MNTSLPNTAHNSNKIVPIQGIKSPDTNKIPTTETYNATLLAEVSNYLLATGGTLMACAPNTKLPDTRFSPDGFNSTPLTAVQLDAAIKSRRNIALVSHPFIQVVDVDRKSQYKPDKVGDVTFAAALAALGSVTVDGINTPIAHTPNGGLHIFIRTAEPMQCSNDIARKFGKDIDLRGGLGKGYLVLPGSFITKDGHGSYLFETQQAADSFVAGDFADVSPAWLDMFKHPAPAKAASRHTSQSTTATPPQDTDDLEAFGQQAVADSRKKVHELHRFEHSAFEVLRKSMSPRQFLEEYAADRYEDDGDRMRRVGSHSRGGVRFYNPETGNASDGYSIGDRCVSDHSTSCAIAAAALLRQDEGYNGKPGFDVTALVGIFLKGEFTADGSLLAEGDSRVIKSWIDETLEDTDAAADGVVDGFLPGVKLGIANKLRTALKRTALPTVEALITEASSKYEPSILETAGQYIAAGIMPETAVDRLIEAASKTSGGNKRSLRKELNKATPSAARIRCSDSTLAGNGLQQWPEYQDTTINSRGELVNLNTIPNVQAVLDAMGVSLRLNEMTFNIEFSGSNVQDADFDIAIARIRSAAEATKFSKPALQDYIPAIADSNQYHPVRDLLTSLQWDGKDHLGFVSDSLESDMDATMKRTLIMRWAVGAVQSVLRAVPEAQQGMLVLQGAQQAGKTTFFSELFSVGIPGAFQTSVKIDPTNKDSLLQIMRHWCIEEGELDATTSKRETGDLKSFITNAVDELRRPYMRAIEQFPRRTCICATVNPTEFLVDQTGNRRFWTIPVTGIRRLSANGFDPLQFWAQIVVLFQAGESHSLTAIELNHLSGINSSHERTTTADDAVLSTYGLPAPAWDTMSTIELTNAGLRHLSASDAYSEVADGDKRGSPQAFGASLVKLGYRKVSVRSGRNGASRYGYWLPKPASHEERSLSRVLGNAAALEDPFAEITIAVAAVVEEEEDFDLLS